MDSGNDIPTPRGGGFTKLIAWQKAYRLALGVYKATRDYPEHERFGLTSQTRRSAASIAVNIAEGWGRGTTGDYLRFVQIARGSANEVQTQLWFARDLGYLDEHVSLNEQVAEVQRLLTGLIRSLMDK